MDYEMEKGVRIQIREQIDEKDCPVCKIETTMIKVVCIGDYYKVKWRCLNCLTLLEENLTKTEV